MWVGTHPEGSEALATDVADSTRAPAATAAALQPSRVVIAARHGNGSHPSTWWGPRVYSTHSLPEGCGRYAEYPLTRTEAIESRTGGARAACLDDGGGGLGVRDPVRARALDQRRQPACAHPTNLLVGAPTTRTTKLGYSGVLTGSAGYPARAVGGTLTLTGGCGR